MAGLKSVRGEGRLVGVVPAMGANGGGCVGGSAVEGADQAVVGQICLQRQLPYGPRNWCVRAYFCLCVFVCVCVCVCGCLCAFGVSLRVRVPMCPRVWMLGGEPRSVGSPCWLERPRPEERHPIE